MMPSGADVENWTPRVTASRTESSVAPAPFWAVNRPRTKSCIQSVATQERSRCRARVEVVDRHRVRPEVDDGTVEIADGASEDDPMPLGQRRGPAEGHDVRAQHLSDERARLRTAGVAQLGRREPEGVEEGRAPVGHDERSRAIVRAQDERGATAHRRAQLGRVVVSPARRGRERHEALLGQWCGVESSQSPCAARHRARRHFHVRSALSTAVVKKLSMSTSGSSELTYTASRVCAKVHAGARRPGERLAPGGGEEPSVEGREHQDGGVDDRLRDEVVRERALVDVGRQDERGRASRARTTRPA